MKKNIYHLWYSRKQERIIAGLHSYMFTSYSSVKSKSIIIEGKRVRYTECRSDGIKKPSGTWNDYIYVGSLPEKDFYKTLEIKES